MRAMGGRRVKEVSTLALFLLAFAMISSASAADGYLIALVSHTFDEATNISTWAYSVNVADDAPRDLGYWVIAWCGGESSIVAAGPGSWEYRSPDKPDPKTGQYGIKFDAGVKKGETVQFWFQLYGDYSEGTVDVAIKAGKDNYTETATGPVFTFTFDLKILDTPTRMVAEAYTDCLTITCVKFVWYGPFLDEKIPTDDPSYLRPELTKMILTPMNGIKPNTYVQEVIVTNDYEGSWYVKAEFQGDYNTRTMCDEVTKIHAPWFTSLPIVLLTTIAFLAFLRRKESTSLCTKI